MPAKPSKFIKIWKELDELTLKYMALKEGGAKVEMQQQSIEHDEAVVEALSLCNNLKSVENKVIENGSDDSNRSLYFLNGFVQNQWRSGHCCMTIWGLGIVSWALIQQI